VEPPDGDRAAIVIGEAKIVRDTEEKKRVWSLASFDLYEHFPDGPESDEFCLLKVMTRRIEWRDSWTANVHVYESAQK
jgi:general stress protein 26